MTYCVKAFSRHTSCVTIFNVDSLCVDNAGCVGFMKIEAPDTISASRTKICALIALFEACATYHKEILYINLFSSFYVQARADVGFGSYSAEGVVEYSVYSALTLKRKSFRILYNERRGQAVSSVRKKYALFFFKRGVNRSLNCRCIGMANNALGIKICFL